MVVCLSVKTATCERLYSYSGDDPELWAKSIRRVMDEPHDKPRLLIGHANINNEWEDSVSQSQIRRLRDRVRLPQYFIEIEKVVQQVSSGQWTQFDLPRDHFKSAVKMIWAVCRNNLPLEEQILSSLQLEGNGGLSVESILSRLLAAGVVARFGLVRDALGHLCKLYLVERAYGQFSIREGMLKR